MGLAGTSLAAKGSYTIHGVPPGSYTLQAWMDSSTLANGNQNAADPAGTASVTVSSANVTGASVTLTDPTVAAPTISPSVKSINPVNLGVVINYSGGSVSNSNGVEEFTSYTVQWSTTSSFSSPSSANFIAIGTGSNVWIVTNGVTGISGSFSNGTAYYFRVRGVNAGGNGPWATWGGATPKTVTIGAPSGTGYYTVTGTVTIPSDITPTGPLYIGFFDESTNSMYATQILTPSNSSPNAYTVSVPAGTNYFFFGILDQNKNGLIDAGDVSNTGNDQSSPTVISGNKTGLDETLPDANSTAAVTTQFNQTTYYYWDFGSGQSGTSTSYYLAFNVREGNKLPVAVQLTSASNPNVITPTDISNYCQGCGHVQFDLDTTIASDVPAVNDTYTFNVTYSDGSTGVVVGKVVAVLDSSALATSLDPQKNDSTSITPTFTWAYPSSAASYTYQFWLCCNSNGTIWQIPGNNSKSNGFTNTQIPGTLTWGVDPTDSTNTPTVNSLTIDSNTIYNWSIKSQDSNGNSAQNSVWYQP